MSDEVLQDNLYWKLFLVALRAKHSMLHLADKYDLALMQMVTLCSIEDNDSICMNSISDILSCDASNVTGIIDRLLSRELIIRQENPQDRRLKMIVLTEKGAALKQKILTELQTHESHILDALTTAQKQELKKLVNLALQPEKPVSKK